MPSAAEAASPRWLPAAVLVPPALLLLAGGTTYPLVWLLWLILVGAAWLLRPARLPDPWLFWPWVAGLLWSLAQLLPLPGSGGHWRERLFEVGLELAQRPAVQLWPQLEGTLGWFAGGWAAFWLLGQDWDAQERRRVLRWFAGGLGVVGLLVWLLTAMGLRSPLAPEVHCFSLLPNRNQMSLLLALGHVLALGLALEELPRRRSLRAVFWVAASGAALLGVVATLSRASLLLAFLGSGILLWRRWRRHGRMGHWRWILPGGILLVGLALAVGGGGIQRIWQLATEGRLGGNPEIRWLLLRDALPLVAEEPWGVGWGHFEAVFPQYRDRTAQVHAEALHPESDWLWWLIEAGWPTVLLAAALAYGLARSLGGWAALSEDRHRFLAALGLALFFAQSWVDVPLHRPATWLPACILLSLAAAPRGAGKPAPAWARLPGLGLILAAGTLGLGWFLDRPWLRHSRPDAEAPLITWTQARALRPLDWQLALGEAQAAVRVEDYARADRALRQAQTLQPILPQPAWMAVRLWASLRPLAALEAARALLAGGVAVNERGLPAMQELTALARDNPRLGPGLERLSREDPVQRALFLEFADPSLLPAAWAWQLEQPPGEWNWPTAQRHALLRRAAASPGSAAKILEWCRRQEDPALVAVEATALATLERPDEASQLILKRCPEPEAPAYGTDLRDSYLMAILRGNPEDFASAGVWVHRLYDRGQTQEALQVLQRIQSWGRAPNWLVYWHARLLTETGRAAEAWPWWDRWLRSVSPSSDL